MLRGTFVVATVAAVIMAVVAAVAQRSRTASSHYDSVGVVPNRFDVPTSSGNPKSHHANAYCGTPVYDRMAASP